MRSHALLSMVGALVTVAKIQIALTVTAAADSKVGIRAYLVSYPPVDSAYLSEFRASPIGFAEGKIVGAPTQTDDQGVAYWSAELSADPSKLFLAVTYAPETLPPGYGAEGLQFRIWDFDQPNPNPIGLLLTKNGQIADDEELNKEVGWLRERSPWAQRKFVDILEYYLRARLAAGYVISKSPAPTASKDYFTAMFRALQIAVVANQRIGIVDSAIPKMTSWMNGYISRVKTGDRSFKRQMTSAQDQAEEITSLAAAIASTTYTKMYESVACGEGVACTLSSKSCSLLSRMQSHFQHDLTYSDVTALNQNGLVSNVVLDFANCIGTALGGKVDPAVVGLSDKAAVAILARAQMAAIDWISPITKDVNLKDKLAKRHIELSAHVPD